MHHTEKQQGVADAMIAASMPIWTGPVARPPLCGGTVRKELGMTFEEILEQALAMLQRQGRVSYRALKRQFDLDDDYLEDLKDEIIDVHQVAVDHDGRMLVWTGEVPTAPAVASPSPPAVTAADQPAQASPSLSHSVPEAERRQLTVMFCDLVGSTELAGRLDLEDWRDVVRAYQETAAAVIQRYAGHLAQLLGDGLLAYFGYPVAHEDDAQRAVHTGLGIVEALGALNTRLEAAYSVQLAVRIGIHTGPVVVGEMGAGDRHEQLALGETPHIAARLEGLAPPNTVVISSTTARLVAEHFECEDLGAHALRGVAAPLRLARVLWEADVPHREAAAAPVGAARLVGREKELDVLLDRWVQSKAGQGQTVLLSGDAGIGKSRLVDALRARVIREGLTRVTFRCSSYHTNSAFYPVLTHLEHLLQFTRDDTSEARFAKLEHVLGTYRFPGDDTLPLFATLLALPLPAHVSPSRLLPEQQRRKIQEDLTAWMREEAERQPVLVVWEDLQWIDPSSLAALRLLIDQTPLAPICTVLTYRPEFTPPWETQSHLTPVLLGPLGPAQSEAMAGTIAEGKTLPPGILTQIVEKTDGVPLFVEEMTKAILESDVLRDAGDHYELTRSVEAVTIPITLHDALMARLDRLGTAKNLAQLGAVIGRQFPYELVKALTAYDEPRLQRELEALVDAELLYQRGLPPDTLYVFKHALLQDVAYESLLRQRRQALHGAIGQAIETLEGERAGEQAAILAYHYARSARQDQAVRYALLAGEQAVRLHARAEATTQYAQALSLAQGLPASPEAQRLQIDAILKLAAVSASRAEMERDQAHLAQAQAWAEAFADEPRLAQVRYWQGRLAYVRGDLQTAITYAEQSLAIADRLADEMLAAPPVNLLGRSYTMRWECVRGSQMLARSTAQMHQLGNRSEEATAAGFAAVPFGLRGEFAQALAYGDHGVALARELANPFAEAAALQYRGLVHDQQGAWTHALADFHAARRVAEGVDDPFRVYLVHLYEGWTATRAGDPAAGQVLLEQFFTLAAQMGTVFFVAMGKACLAACFLALGKLETVPALCQEAQRMAEATADRFAQAVASRALAEALTWGPAPDRPQAEQAMGAAIRLFTELEFRPELARSYVCYARVLQQWGQPETAAHYLSEAMRLFQAMGMAWDLAQAAEVHRALRRRDDR